MKQSFQHLIECYYYQDTMEGILKTDTSINNACASQKHQLQILMVEVNPLVTKNGDSDHQEKSLLKAFATSALSKF